jgi:Holliday junction resolvasome RuvABC ATP-dependent DNA helicase subunit
MTRKPEPVGIDELQRAILRTIVREFDGRPLDVDTATQALALAAFELKMVALRAVANGKPLNPGRKS